MNLRFGLYGALMLCTCWAWAGSRANDAVHIYALTVVDQQFMAAQRNLIQDLAARHLGRSISGERDRDLNTLQTLLDERLVRSNQTRELQAMGLIMGDLLATELDLHWVIYEDKLGRSRALRYKETDTFLFPMTMISRRREADNHSTVAAIYQKAHDSIAAQKPVLPFQ